MQRLVVRSGDDALEAAEHRVAVVDSELQEATPSTSRSGPGHRNERMKKDVSFVSMQKVNDIPR
jgi:hypothetical protein